MTENTILGRRSVLGLAALAGVGGLTALAAPAQAAGSQLSARFTVSGMKAAGYAGLVALRIKNNGTKRYFADFPVVSFRLDVHTASGPEGVDRFITPGWFNGAYTRDLGFDEATGIRSFEVTLANPIEPGQEQLIANLSFGDGGTRLGRVVNYATLTQTGFAAGDASASAPLSIDSRTATTTDGGGKSAGLF